MGGAWILGGPRGRPFAISGARQGILGVHGGLPFASFRRFRVATAAKDPTTTSQLLSLNYWTRDPFISGSPPAGYTVVALPSSSSGHTSSSGLGSPQCQGCSLRCRGYRGNLGSTRHLMKKALVLGGRPRRRTGWFWTAFRRTQPEEHDQKQRIGFFFGSQDQSGQVAREPGGTAVREPNGIGPSVLSGPGPAPPGFARTMAPLTSRLPATAKLPATAHQKAMARHSVHPGRSQCLEPSSALWFA